MKRSVLPKKIHTQTRVLFGGKNSSRSNCELWIVNTYTFTNVYVSYSTKPLYFEGEVFFSVSPVSSVGIVHESILTKAYPRYQRVSSVMNRWVN